LEPEVYHRFLNFATKLSVVFYVNYGGQQSL